jgi:hypothetical protein
MGHRQKAWQHERLAHSRLAQSVKSLTPAAMTQKTLPMPRRWFLVPALAGMVMALTGAGTAFADDSSDGSDAGVDPPAATNDSSWGDLYTSDSCSGALDDLGLVEEDCDYNDGNPRSSGSIGTDLVLQTFSGPLLQYPDVQSGAAGTTTGTTTGSPPSLHGQYLSPQMVITGRSGHLLFGLGMGGFVPMNGARGGGPMGDLSLNYGLRIRWFAPYAGVTFGGGGIFSTRYPPGSTSRYDGTTASMGLIYLAGQVGARIYISPYMALGAYAQKSFLANHSFSGVGLTFGFDVPLGDDD